MNAPVAHKCRLCGNQLAIRTGVELTFTVSSVMLYDRGFTLLCVCGEVFYFDLRKCGPLPRKNELRQRRFDAILA